MAKIVKPGKNVTLYKAPFNVEITCNKCGCKFIEEGWNGLLYPVFKWSFWMNSELPTDRWKANCPNCHMEVVVKGIPYKAHI